MYRDEYLFKHVTSNDYPMVHSLYDFYLTCQFRYTPTDEHTTRINVINLSL